MKTRNTRERILEAGLKLFSKHGYLGATTKAIAELAGVSEVTLFRYFPSKEKLFGEIINRYSFLPALKGLVFELKGTAYRDALSEIAARFIERLHERRDLIRIMHSEMHRYPDKIRKIYRGFVEEMFETLASYFRAMQKRRNLRRFDAELGAKAFLGMFFSYFNSRELMIGKRPGPDDAERTILEFVDIFIRGTAK
jgi:AcrR family transcriptional regulator